MIGPAPILAVIVGLFHVSAYVFIRGRAGARIPLLLVAAMLGAWAGDAVGARMAIDPLRIGEFHLVSASLVAWLAIGLVVVMATLVPERRPVAREPRVSTSLTHAHAAAAVSTGVHVDAPSITDVQPEVESAAATEPATEPEKEPST